jgi:class 3 adenylate cyclase
MARRKGIRGRPKVPDVRADEIIDVDVDPVEARRARWRRLARFGVPLAGVVLIVAAIIAVTLHSYRTNRDDALALSQNLVAAIDQRVQTEVGGYLEPAARAVRTLAGMRPEGGLAASGRPLLERLARTLLQDRPQLASLFVGDPQGNFLMVQRSPEGTLDTKLIAHEDGRRQVTWYRRDATGQVVAVEEDPADPFDPRTRPWYHGASAMDGLFWTDVYVFFTTQEPGLTVAHAMRGEAGELLGIAGGDITLAELSSFLADLELGANGRALIVDGAGRLVAFPDPARIVEGSDGDYRPAQMATIGDPVLVEAYDRTRVAGAGRSIVEIDGQRHVVAAAALAEPAAQDWRLLLVIPEDDLVGFVAANSQRTLLLSSGIVALAIGLAGLLAYQGLAADRNARILRRREQAIAAQTAAFDELAATASLLEAGDRDALRRLTETVARTLAARRVGLWQLDPRQGGITCLDCYDQESNGHTAGTDIRRAEGPELLAAIERGEEIVVADAAQDARTAGLARGYLGAVGSRALLSVPIRRGAVVSGCLWIEDAGAAGRQGVEAQSFARTIAHLVGTRFAPASEPEMARPVAATAAGAAPERSGAWSLEATGASLRTASLADERHGALLRTLRRRGLDEDGLLGAVYPDTTVLVLRFLDDLTLAAPADAEQQVGVVGQIVSALQEITRRHEVRYLKIMANQIVAAEGFDGDGQRAAAALAEVALAVHDACARGFAAAGGRLDYAIGLDTGTVIGCAVGFGQTAYNVWGDAVRVAASLAASAQPGTIQVSEAAYARLRGRFVLQRRGGFYIDQVGEMATYALRGRL